MKNLEKELEKLGVENWDEATARLFACDCAERVLHIYEKAYPWDKRIRKAIEAARNYAETLAKATDLPYFFVQNAKKRLEEANGEALVVVKETLGENLNDAVRYAMLAGVYASSITGKAGLWAIDAAYAALKAELGAKEQK